MRNGADSKINEITLLLCPRFGQTAVSVFPITGLVIGKGRFLPLSESRYEFKAAWANATES